MLTDDLIGLLAHDTPRALEWWQRPALLIAGGAAASLLLFAIILDTRVDLFALTGARATLGKWLAAGVLVGLAGLAAFRLRRPEASVPLTPLILAFLGLAAFSIGADLAVNGAADIGRRMLGSSAVQCLGSIGFLSLPVLAAFLVLLRQGAVTAPERAGLVSGLAAASLAAAIYALHCNEDGPLFVVTWYGLGVLLVGAFGAFLGRWALRW